MLSSLAPPPEVCGLFIDKATTAAQPLRLPVPPWPIIISRMAHSHSRDTAETDFMPLLPYSVSPGQPPAQNPAGYPISHLHGKQEPSLRNRAFLGWRPEASQVLEAGSLAVFFSVHSEEQHGPWSVLGRWEQLIASEVPHSQAPAPQV